LDNAGSAHLVFPLTQSHGQKLYGSSFVVSRKFRKYILVTGW
jgi:hypothetical protein